MRGADRDLMEDRLVAGPLGGPAEIADSREPLLVARRVPAAGGVVLVEEREAAVEHRRLEGVEAAVGADESVVVPPGLAMVRVEGDARHEVGVAPAHRAAVAVAAEVLRRVEAPRRELAEAADPPPLPARPVRLRGVLDDPEAKACGARRAPRSRTAAVEVDAEDPHRAR